jgi:glycosyltransferase involved in cell wall biosynthesis
MPKITAILHTYNDAQRIGRALESLRACAEVLVIDHASSDGTVEIARHQGATVKEAVLGVDPGVYVIDARHDWIFCMLPNEAISESLEASLFEWKELEKEPLDEAGKEAQAALNESFSVGVREETENGWKTLTAETRLVNRKQINWSQALPPNIEASIVLAGDLLRFSKP